MPTVYGFRFQTLIGKGREQGFISMFNALVVIVHPRRIDGNDRQGQALFSHALQGLVVRTDDGRDRRADDGRKRRIDCLGRITELVDQAVVTAEDGVHIAQAGAEDGTFFSH